MSSDAYDPPGAPLLHIVCFCFCLFPPLPTHAYHLVDLPEFHIHSKIFFLNNLNLYLLFWFFCSNLDALFFFSCLIDLDKISTVNTMLNKIGKNRHLCRVPDLRRKDFSFSLLSIMFSVSLSYMAFFILRYVPIVLTLLRILSQMNVGFCQMLFLHILRSSYDSNPSFCECGVSCWLICICQTNPASLE